MPYASQVVLYLIDGLRPDAITPETMPRLHALAGRGHYATGRTIRPSVTVAALTTLASGVSPERHGLTEPKVPALSRLRSLRPVPQELKRYWHRTAIVISDLPGGERLVAKSLLALAGVGSLVSGGRLPSEVCASAVRHLLRERPSFTAIYVNDTDKAGHAHGWMSDKYLEAAARADEGIASLAPLAQTEGTLVLITADHGGGGVQADDHDAPHPINDTIPLIAVGPTVEPRVATDAFSILDLPPTVLHALGVPVPAIYEGRVLTELFGVEAALQTA